jgi:hypothetical protein
VTAADPDRPLPEEAPTRFQPRVEAEEGDPNRGDYIIGVVIAVVVVAGLLWAFGVFSF